MARYQWSILVPLILPAAALAQTEKTAPAKPNQAEVRLADGSRVRMTILQENLEVITRYGKLAIPTAEIRNIEFGIRPGEGIGKKVDDAVKRLGDESFDTRENAVGELVAVGAPAYKALLRAAKSSEPEVARLARSALEKIRQKLPEDKLRVKEDDTVRTTEFTIVGRIAGSTIKAATPIFGETQLRLSDLRGIRWLGIMAESEVTVDGARYAAAANEWMDTGVEVTGDDELAITASGQVDLMGNGNAQFISGPNGTNQWGGVRPNVAMPPGAFNAAQHPGTLLGRIGDSGPVFVIGENYKGTPRREGKLYLQIGTSPWANNGNARISGSYKVNIAGGHEAADR
jgi:hypothetical protein